MRSSQCSAALIYGINNRGPSISDLKMLAQCACLPSFLLVQGVPLKEDPFNAKYFNSHVGPFDLHLYAKTVDFVDAI